MFAEKEELAGRHKELKLLNFNRLFSLLLSYLSGAGRSSRFMTEPGRLPSPPNKHTATCVQFMQII